MRDKEIRDMIGLQPFIFVISKDRRTRLLLWEQEIGSSNLSTPTLTSPSIVEDRGIFVLKTTLNTINKTHIRFSFQTGKIIKDFICVKNRYIVSIH